MVVVPRVVQAALAVFLVGSLAACGAAPTVQQAGPTPSQDVTTSVQTPTVTQSPTPTSTASTASSPSGPPIVMATPGASRQVLLLSDAFDKGQWTEGSYVPANETAAVNNAMALKLRCNARTIQWVEYRFAQVTGRIQVQVAQDMRSEASDAELEFSLEADGRKTEAKNINFKGKAELSTDLAGVTVLKIGVGPAPNNPCRGNKTVNALITSVVIQS